MTIKVSFTATSYHYAPAKLEKLIEDKHNNSHNKGTITYYYLKTGRIKNNEWNELLDKVISTDIEITGHDAFSKDIIYIPLNFT